jgi:hypothetical protein
VPDERKELVTTAVKDHQTPIRQACKWIDLSTSVYYYKPRRTNAGAQIRSELRQLVRLHNSWGFRNYQYANKYLHNINP